MNHFSSYSFEHNPDWTKSYSSQPEIHEYLGKVANKYDSKRYRIWKESYENNLE